MLRNWGLLLDVTPLEILENRGDHAQPHLEVDVDLRASAQRLTLRVLRDREVAVGARLPHVPAAGTHTWGHIAPLVGSHGSRAVCRAGLDGTVALNEAGTG